MKNILKKSRFYIGITLLMQSVTMVVLFFSQWRKRKSLSAAFAAIAAISGTLGGYLVASSAKEEEERLSAIDALCGDYFYDDDYDLEDDDGVLCRRKDSDDIAVEDEADENEAEQN